MNHQHTGEIFWSTIILQAEPCIRKFSLLQITSKTVNSFNHPSMSKEFVQTSNGKASIRSCITSRIDGLERKPMRFASWLTGRCDNHHPERERASQLDQTCSRGCDEEIAQCFVTFTGRRLIMWILRFHTQCPNTTESNSRRVWKRKTETPAMIQFRDKHNSESWKKFLARNWSQFSYQISWDFSQAYSFVRSKLNLLRHMLFTHPAACWIRLGPIT